MDSLRDVRPRIYSAPSDELVNPLLTDLYQISMAYAYWKSGRHLIPCTFDLFYREPPFKANYIVFAGLEECVRFISTFCFEPDHAAYVARVVPNCDPTFLSWLQTLNCSRVSISALPEGSVAFPHVPLMKVSGPLAIVQLLETTLLNLINYASLVATNAHRFRRAACDDVQLFEFGLRRAQGPNGGLTASKYCYLGGFDGSSNVAAGYEYGIPLKGTHAHSFVQSFTSLEQAMRLNMSLQMANEPDVPIRKFAERVLELRAKLFPSNKAVDGELASFIVYAVTYPSTFSALVDTYNTMESGVPNFLCVSLALAERGYAAVGLRLDSGDLAELSIQVEAQYRDTMAEYRRIYAPEDDYYKTVLGKLGIMVSNDVTVDMLKSMRTRHHEITAFGIGTHLVTCKEHPALGCVYKIASIGASPCMKYSEEPKKSTTPGDKAAYRLYDVQGFAAADVLQLQSEEAPLVGKAQDFVDRRDHSKIVAVIPKRVEVLLRSVSTGDRASGFQPPLQQLNRARDVLQKHVSCLQKSVLLCPRVQDNYPVLLTKKLSEMMKGLRESHLQNLT